MTTPLSLSAILFCSFAGLFVGAVYFGGLWWTVKMLPTAQSKTRLLLVSWLLRNAFFLGVFFWVMERDWRRLLIAFAGMILVRLGMTIYMKMKNKNKTNAAEASC